MVWKEISKKVGSRNSNRPKIDILYLSRSEIFYSEKFDIDVNLSEIQNKKVNYFFITFKELEFPIFWPFTAI